jgi:hypothetical protein
MKYEYKYIVPRDILPELRSRIAPFMVHDEYMAFGGPEGYTVRSIYCDTLNFDDYHEKYSGIKIRKKIRIRGYNEEDPDNIVFLEVKRKNEKKIYKNRAPVKFKNLKDIMITGDIDKYVQEIKGFKAAKEDSKHFLFNYYTNNLRPVVTVIYDREAFHGAFDKSFRITFDKNLRSVIHPDLNCLYREDDVKYSNVKNFIFEVKFFHIFPSWLKSIIGTLKLDLKAFSKYTTCVDEHNAVNRTTRLIQNDYVRQVSF